MTPSLRILQIATTLHEPCGIGYFAQRMGTALSKAGAQVRTVDGFVEQQADVIIVHHHGELVPSATLRAFAYQARAPVVLMPHDDTCGSLYGDVSAVVALTPELIAGAKRSYWFPHPSETFRTGTARSKLRERYGLPKEKLILGTNGFLKYERSFDIVTAAVLKALPEVAVSLVLSPWRLPSPGLLEKLVVLCESHPGRLNLAYEKWSDQERFDRLRACDLLWCWVDAPSSPYASGVVSDQYASGTRLVTTDKSQHRHVLSLPNVVTAPPNLEGFLDTLIAAARQPCLRHDPEVIAWERQMPGLLEFLESLT
ncbi:hypothetical protein E2K80_04820 [Rhodophyticola sp. CCM32]|uniref:hypothetical protein n=1 Tax=Rhodophyticola sp. CCM32 TaxID=2916397 RepID=UPI00107F8420|nr:hypothetical protein [Rhodophyticola sp. CCM32]QBY00143.1 hypothetical protein E2K80_04820 [Rhodophyticola sp. CCM32]